MSFKRLNFFKGLFTTADDWKAEQQYHSDKRKLHNRCLHMPGVVVGEGDELRVIVTPQGSIIVQPGYAVDGHGRDLYLPTPEEVIIPPDAIAPGSSQEVYVFVSYREEKVERRESRLSPDHSDHAFIQERPIVGWAVHAPDNKDKIELARFSWRSGQSITSDQIDLSHVKYAGAMRPITHVKSDYIVLNPSPPDGGMQFALGDSRVIIQSFRDPLQASGTVYVANVFPVEVSDALNQDSRIIWRVESSITQAKEVAYYLVLKNIGTIKVKARFEVYRLNSGRQG